MHDLCSLVDLVIFKRFLAGAHERLPGLAETKANLSVHTVGMELNLNGLLNDGIQVWGFSGEDGGFVKLIEVSQVDSMFSYTSLVWMFKIYVPLMLLQNGVHRRACLPNVDLATFTRDYVYT
jgi:hypothetical protein